MVFDNFEQVGQTDQHTSHNVQSNRVKFMFTTSQSQVKGEHCFGMLTLIGLEPPSMVL